MKRLLNYRMLFFLIMFCNIPAFLLAQEQELPVLKDVTIKATMNYDQSTGLYIYNYAIANPASNRGQISMVELDISKPESASDLNSEGLVVILGVSRRGKIISQSFDKEMLTKKPLMKTAIVPVGVKPPPGWGARIAVIGTVLWGSDEKEYRIIPGEVRGGFEVASRGIPSLREIIVRPKWILMVAEVTEEDEETTKRIEKEIAFYTKTIGPTAPPKELKPLEFLDGIISMKHEAFKLGWITSDAIVLALDQKLDAARKKLEQGNKKAASEILKAFINEVEAQGCESYEVKCPPGKHLKPEAYALLKYNAQYLVDNLK